VVFAWLRVQTHDAFFIPAGAGLSVVEIEACQAIRWTSARFKANVDLKLPVFALAGPLNVWIDVDKVLADIVIVHLVIGGLRVEEEIRVLIPVVLEKRLSF
jgi:hypothetical protein